MPPNLRISLSKEDKYSIPPLSRLIGDELDNFYQLGLKDRERHHLLLSHATGLFRLPWKGANSALQETMKALMFPALEMHPRFKKRIQAYAEGLDRPVREVAFALLVPELMCFMNNWIPGIPHTIFGCSSFFVWCEKRDQLVHGRILDFPFHSSFDTNERFVQSALDGGPVTFSFSSEGFPYPSITAMTESGISLALHQKFGQTFYYQGTPIFDLAYEMLQKCDSREECIRFLKRQKSITSWSMYMGFQDGKILSAELDGELFHYNPHQISEKKMHYFCNVRENPNMISNETLPYGFNEYNQMRLNIRSLKEKKFLSASKSKSWSAEKLIRFMGTSYDQGKIESQDWQMDPLTPSTLQTVAMIPGIGEALFLPGKAPKFFNGEIISIENAFNEPKTQIKHIKGKVDPSAYQKGTYHYMQSQVAHDLGDYHHCYHHIQLAIDFFGEHPMGNIALFYFSVFQYIHEEHKKVLSNLLKNFKSLDGFLPTYLADHNSLFIARLEKILKNKITIGIDEIQHPSLQKVFEFEKSMPLLLFHKSTSKLMAPRLELLDIIYPHVRT